MDSQAMSFYNVRGLVVDGQGSALETDFQGDPNTSGAAWVGQRPFDIQDRDGAIGVHAANEMHTTRVQREFS